jgi:hypothetical protein
VSAEQFRRGTGTEKEQAQSLAEFLLRSPRHGARLRIRRSRDTGRPVKFGE